MLIQEFIWQIFNAPSGRLGIEEEGEGRKVSSSDRSNQMLDVQYLSKEICYTLIFYNP